MKKLLLLSLIMLGMVQKAMAWAEIRPYNEETGEKGLYKPNVWSYNSRTGEYTYDGVSYSVARSKESTNFVLYWSSEYGTTAPDELSTSDYYYVNTTEMLNRAESFYQMYAETLKFVDPTKSTTMSKYKCMLCLIHTTTWNAYGGGYDYVIPALWVNPDACKGNGHTLAHEVGHSFHYMCFSEASNHQDSKTIGTGFHLPLTNGQSIWEQTAQWQAAQMYPSMMFSQSYPLFGNNANYAFTHEWMRYQSYWFHYYLCDHYNDMSTVGQVWNQPMTGAVDFNQSLMALKNLSVEQFFELYFDYALHCATYDFTAAVRYRNSYIGKFDYHAVKLDENKYQVAYSSVPQSTGFNVIELNVPGAGTTVTTKFTALKPGCPLESGDPGEYNNGNANSLVNAGVTSYNNVSQAAARGFRVGYVFLKSDNTREYYNDNTVHCTGTDEVTEEISAAVPANTTRMFLVISPSLSTYIQHQWDENIKNDDQWPYQFELTGTKAKNITPYIKEPEFEQVIDGRGIADVTLTYNVVLPPANGYDGASVNFSGSGLRALCTAFQLTGDEIFNKIVAYNASGPQNGQIMNYAANANGTLQSAGKGTNGDFGHWFNASGTAISFGNGCSVYTEFTKANKGGTVGQYPNANSNGTKRTVREALRYKDDNGNIATAYLIFNVTFETGTTAYSYLTDIQYTEPKVSTQTATVQNVIKMKKIQLSIGADNTASYSLTSDELDNLCEALHNVKLVSLSGVMFRGFYSPFETLPATLIYYYALKSEPEAAQGEENGSIEYYDVSSQKTGNQYLYYFDEATNLVYSPNQSMFSLAFDNKERMFSASVNDGIEDGIYNVWVGLVRKVSNVINIAYFPVSIYVNTPVEEEPTGIISTYSGEGGIAGNVYDLQGRRVNANDIKSLPRGIYIVGGHKVMVK